MWRILGASAVGTVHQASASACQDVFAFDVFSDSVAAVVVADGAGSARLGGVGAEVAVGAALAHLAGALRGSELIAADTRWTVVKDAIDVARTAVLARAAESESDVSDFATTLQAALFWDTGCAYARVGDGICVILGDGFLQSLGPAPATEFVNETQFLTTPGAAVESLLLEQEISCAAMSTDGLVPIAMRIAQGQPHEPFFKPLFSFVEGSTSPDDASHLARFLDSPQVRQRTDDDTSLVLAVWRR